jgi:hypothetical protein
MWNEIVKLNAAELGQRNCISKAQSRNAQKMQAKATLELGIPLLVQLIDQPVLVISRPATAIATSSIIRAHTVVSTAASFSEYPT